MSQAAAQDYEHAMYYLGILYMGGYGIDADLAQSYRWFERSANRAYARGYFEGIGRERDLIKAHAFLSLGQALGHKPSEKLLQKVLAEFAKQGPDLSFVEMPMAFMNVWGAADAPDPKCVVPAVGQKHEGS